MAECCLCGENHADAHSPRTENDVHTNCLVACYADMQTYGLPPGERTDEIIDMARDVLGI
jgi:hypothetical protein